MCVWKRSAVLSNWNGKGWAVLGLCCPLKDCPAASSHTRTIGLKQTALLSLLHVLPLTGGGSGAQEWLLGRRLGSRTSLHYSSAVCFQEFTSGVPIKLKLKCFISNCVPFITFIPKNHFRETVWCAKTPRNGCTQSHLKSEFQEAIHVNPKQGR